MDFSPRIPRGGLKIYINPRKSCIALFLTHGRGEGQGESFATNLIRSVVDLGEQ